jgi:hypothetical protein
MKGKPNMSITVKYFDGNLAAHNCGTPHTVMQAIMTIDEQIAELNAARKAGVKWLEPQVLAMDLTDDKYLVGKLCATFTQATERTGLNTVHLIGKGKTKSTPDVVGDGFIAKLRNQQLIDAVEYQDCFTTSSVSAKFRVYKPTARA